MIETVDLTKKYGDFVALDSLDLKLERGDLFGFIGPNGAGKTTTIRILATLLAPTWGEAYVCGYSVHTHPREIRRAIGYMPDVFGVYDDMRVGEYLEFFAAAYRITGPERRRVAERSLELVDLGSKRDELVTSLSRGMTQRLGLARVLLHDPEVLLLDEPFGALDALTRGTIQDELLKICAATHQTVFMITHDVDEAILLADKILLMSNGPVARVAEVVCNTLPRDRQRAALHHEPGFYELRNHLVDFLVSRSKDLSRGRAPAHPPEVRPADAARRPSTTAATPGGALHLQRVA